MEDAAVDRYVSGVLAALDEQARALPDTPTNRIIRSLFEHRLSLVDVARLQHIHTQAERCRNLPGAFVECGVAKGASLAMMAADAGDRAVWGFDSFEGLPEQTASDSADGAMFVGYRCSGDAGEAAVADTFAKVGVSMDRVQLRAGWFADTLPIWRDRIGPIAILRVDADWYEGTRFVLEQLHHQVVPGGVVLVDDYTAFSGCAQAVREFRDDTVCGDLQVGPTGEGFWYKLG